MSPESADEPEWPDWKWAAIIGGGALAIAAIIAAIIAAAGTPGGAAAAPLRMGPAVGERTPAFSHRGAGAQRR